MAKSICALRVYGIHAENLVNNNVGKVWLKKSRLYTYIEEQRSTWYNTHCKVDIVCKLRARAENRFSKLTEELWDLLRGFKYRHYIFVWVYIYIVISYWTNESSPHMRDLLIQRRTRETDFIEMHCLKMIDSPGDYIAFSSRFLSSQVENNYTVWSIFPGKSIFTHPCAKECVCSIIKYIYDISTRITFTSKTFPAPQRKKKRKTRSKLVQFPDARASCSLLLEHPHLRVIARDRLVFIISVIYLYLYIQRGREIVIKLPCSCADIYTLFPCLSYIHMYIRVWVWENGFSREKLDAGILHVVRFGVTGENDGGNVYIMTYWWIASLVLLICIGWK